MTAWHKIKFFHDTMLGSAGSTLTATSTAAGYDVANLYNMLEVNSWKAADTTDPCYITYDAGAGNTKSADYLAILGHNLYTLGASVILQSSTDNFAANVGTVIAERVTADTALLSEARIVVNGDFEVWSAGTNVAPDGWYTGGTGPFAREAVNVKSGLYSAAITYASGATCELNQNLGQSGIDLSWYGGKTMTFGCWIKTSVAGQARLQVIDNGGSTASAEHTGGGGWEFITVTRTITASPTSITLKLQVYAVGTAYFDGVVVKVASSLAATDASDVIQPSSNAKRYWRLKLSNDNGAAFSAAPYMALAIWGSKTELDYATASFDPHEQEVKGGANLSQGGYVTGVHTDYVERSMTLRFEDADADLYAKVKDWWDRSGLKNFFVAWETANSPSDVYLMRPDTKFSNPLKNGGLYRDITLNLKGRKE